MNTLILLTNFFPYGNGEPYLETEAKFYEQFFDRIYVCSLQLRKKDLHTIRKLPSKSFEVLPVEKAANWVYLANAVRTLFDKNIYVELWRLLRTKRLSAQRVVSLFVYLSRSYYEADKITKWLKTKKIISHDDEGVIYSYRFEYQPYVALLLKKHLPNFNAFSRGHGYDLYEERHKSAYIPLREYLLKHLDKSIMIAQNGVDYLSKKYPRCSDKITVSRLGVTDNGLGAEVNRENGLRIISCSTITAVKRVELIVEALALIKDIPIVWDHYGEGPLADEVKTLAKEIIPSNITYNFRGYIDNHQLLQIYKTNPYHLFLNVSSSEGVPVSIMEAMSFGIPCVATDVGGTNEIVSDKYNGILLAPDFQTDTLAQIIGKFATMDDICYKEYRSAARLTWSNKYSASKNYSKFLKYLRDFRLYKQ